MPAAFVCTFYRGMGLHLYVLPLIYFLTVYYTGYGGINEFIRDNLFSVYENDYGCMPR